MRVGHWREWHGNGKLWLDVTYVAGKAEGRWLEYDATGTLMFEGTYRASRLDGGWHAYRPGDQVLASGTSSDGRLEGALRYATRDGGGRWEKGYLDNRPHGTWKYFVEERLVYEMTYRHGFLHGPMTEYDQAGAVVGAWEYRDGELVTTTPAADEAPRD